MALTSTTLPWCRGFQVGFGVNLFQARATGCPFAEGSLAAATAELRKCHQPVAQDVSFKYRLVADSKSYKEAFESSASFAVRHWLASVEGAPS